MSDLITYDDKIRLKSQNVSEKYKVTAGDMNEIKSVVNTNAEEVDEINKPENWVSVGTEAPTDGRRVWLKKGKNLLKLNIITTATTYSGVTFTPNNDGTITLNGTATSSRWVDLSNMEISSNSFNLGAVTNTTKSLTNNNYTLSAKLTNGQVNVSFNSTNKMTSCYLYENTTYNNAILQIQFEKGPATTYEQYIEASINVDEELLYQKPVVLWTNPNPTSSFASQDIQLNDNTENYSYWEVVFSGANTNHGYTTGKLPTRLTTTNLSFPRPILGYRTMTIKSANHSQIYADNYQAFSTYGGSGTADNARAIPYQILGYKEQTNE